MTEVATDTKNIEETVSEVEKTASELVCTLVGQLADEIIKGLPTSDLTAVIDKEVIRKGIHDALSPEVAKFVKGKMDEIKGALEEGTEASMARATELISGLTSTLDELRSYLAAALLEEVGFKRLDNDGAEVTLPEGMTIVDFGYKANVLCSELGIGPAFDIIQTGFWQRNESDPSTQTVVGKTYRFRVEDTLVDKSRRDHVEILAPCGREMPPLGALALATMCVHLQSQGQEKFLKNLWVRASTERAVMWWNAQYGGIHVRFDFGDGPAPNVACAASVEPPREPQRSRLATFIADRWNAIF